MKNFAVSALLLGSMSLVSMSAMAEASFYLSGSVGFYSGEDVEVYGTNLAANPEFPNSYDGDSGESVGIAIGLQLDENWRVQLGYSSRELDAGGTKFGNSGFFPVESFDYTLDSEMDMDTLMLEGFYDFNLDSDFRPYVKVGIGITENDVQTTLVSTTDPLFLVLGENGFLREDGLLHFPERSETEFTWSVGIGVNYAINDSWFIGAEYQHIDMGEALSEVGLVDEFWGNDDLSIDEFDVVVTYRF